MSSRGLEVKRSWDLEVETGQEQVRNRSETGQKQVRNGSETGQKQVRNGSETGQKRVRNGSVRNRSETGGNSSRRPRGGSLISLSPETIWESVQRSLRQAPPDSWEQSIFLQTLSNVKCEMVPSVTSVEGKPVKPMNDPIRPESTMNTETAKSGLLSPWMARAWPATEARKSTPWSRAKRLSPRIAWNCLARPSQIRIFLQFRKRCINQTLNLPCSTCVIGKGLNFLATDART